MDKQLGLEETPDEYVANLVSVFRELWRVLRDDGTLWLNLGDSYATGTKASRPQFSPNGTVGANRPEAQNSVPRVGTPTGLKTKDLVGIPWRVAFALQADGWYLRSDIIWHKKNPMPESVTDRPSKAHEYIFLLTKKAKYWYDQEAIREEASSDWKNRGGSLLNNTGWHTSARGEDATRRNNRDDVDGSVRNKRTVWSVATKPFKGAHFATFPPDLIEPCILAGCPSRVCVECEEPWVRVVEKSRATHGKTEDPTMKTGRKGMNRKRLGQSDKYILGVSQPELAVMLKRAARGKIKQMKNEFGSKWGHWTRTDDSGARIPTFEDAERLKVLLGVEIPFNGKKVGFAPTCQCNAHHRPGVVLDPFFGSGTVAEVAIKTGRYWLGVELNSEYIKLARDRIWRTPPPLFVIEAAPAPPAKNEFYMLARERDALKLRLDTIDSKMEEIGCA